jgi:acetyl-CoA synthetase
MTSPQATIESILKEQRLFPPPAEFVEKARVNAQEYERLQEWAQRDPEGFWAEQAKILDWFTPWSQVLDWSNAPHARWFVGGKLNASYNLSLIHI